MAKLQNTKYDNENQDEYDIKINFKEDSYLFDKKTYIKSLLEKLITEKDYEEIISKCSKLLGTSLNEKKNNDEIKFPKVLTLGMIGCIIILITFFATLSPALTNHPNNEALFVISVILGIIMIFFTIPLSIYNYWYPIRSFKNLSYFIVKNINNYLSEVNREYKGKLIFGLNDTGSEANRFLYVIVEKYKNE